MMNIFDSDDNLIAAHEFTDDPPAEACPHCGDTDPHDECGRPPHLDPPAAALKAEDPPPANWTLPNEEAGAFFDAVEKHVNACGGVIDMAKSKAVESGNEVFNQMMRIVRLCARDIRADPPQADVVKIIKDLIDSLDFFYNANDGEPEESDMKLGGETLNRARALLARLGGGG